MPEGALCRKEPLTAAMYCLSIEPLTDTRLVLMMEAERITWYVASLVRRCSTLRYSALDVSTYDGNKTRKITGGMRLEKFCGKAFEMLDERKARTLVVAGHSVISRSLRLNTA